MPESERSMSEAAVEGNRKLSTDHEPQLKMGDGWVLK